MSRPLAFLRRMHTPGRQIPHPATPSTSPSPHGHGHLPSASLPASSAPLPPAAPLAPHVAPPAAPADLDDAADPASSSRTYRKLPAAAPRPPRAVRLTLPSGLPEPPTYPPPREYLSMVDGLKADADFAPRPHPLWAFFHLPSGAEAPLTKDSAFPPDGGSIEIVSAEQVDSGRAWTAPELRQKSFADLHTLWYVLLRERNVLATQREERRRLGISPSLGGEEITRRAFRIRKAMSRIKYVLNERRLALLALPTPASASAGPAPVPFGGSGGAHALPDPASGAAAHALEPAALDALAARLHAPPVEAADAGAAEVEGRDEGFGGGAEARAFVEHTEVAQDGHVRAA